MPRSDQPARHALSGHYPAGGGLRGEQREVPSIQSVNTTAEIHVPDKPGAGAPAHTNLERFNHGSGDFSNPKQRSLTTALERKRRGVEPLQITRGESATVTIYLDEAICRSCLRLNIHPRHLMIEALLDTIHQRSLLAEDMKRALSTR